MAIPVPVPTKPFAHLHDVEGVPLDDMNPLLGEANHTYMGSTNELSDPATELAEAAAINSFVSVSPTTHDRIEIYDPAVSGLRFGLSVDDFLNIHAANIGSTLSATAATPTAKAVVDVGTGQTMLVGRTTSNGVLIQAGTYPVGSTPREFRLNVVSYNLEGVLHRRISPFENHATRQIIVHRHAPVKPAAPAGGEVGFDGTRVSVTDESEWAPIDLPISGTDPLWIATGTFQYIFSLTRWTLRTAWAVHPGSSTFRVQYASSESGPWGSSDPGGTNLWVRYRLDDGTWSTHQVRGISQRSWRTLAVVSLGTGVSAASRGIPSLDLEDTEWVSISYQDDTGTGPGLQGNVIPVVIPAWVLRGTDPTDGALGANSLLFVFDAITGGSVVRGNYMFANQTAYNDWRGNAHASEQRGHINFSGQAENDLDVTNVRVLRGYTGRLGVVTVRTI